MGEEEGCLQRQQALLLVQEVDRFDALVGQVEGLCETGLCLYGGCADPATRILSPLCLVPEGIPFVIDGVEHTFDTAEHVHAFLAYGVPDGISHWVRGGIMSSFVRCFGEDAGTSMESRHGTDMVGLVPQLMAKPARAQLRSAHGIVLKTSPMPQEECMQYAHWRQASPPCNMPSLSLSLSL